MTEVIDARRDGRWADASEALERWVASQRQAALGYAPAESSGSRPGSAARASVLTPRGMFSRQRTTSAASAELRDRVPRAARMLQKAGLGGERPLYLCYVQKRNEHGKVQKRALLLTDAAIYNADTTVEKLKRRVPLESIASVTADESSGQFVLHVPSEYDYFFAGESSGYDASEGGGAAATSSIGVIDALQRAYTSTGRPPLPVRNATGGGGDLSTIVQKKKSAEDARISAQGKLQPYDDDSD